MNNTPQHFFLEEVSLQYKHKFNTIVINMYQCRGIRTYFTSKCRVLKPDTSILVLIPGKLVLVPKPDTDIDISASLMNVSFFLTKMLFLTSETVCLSRRSFAAIQICTHVQLLWYHHLFHKCELSTQPQNLCLVQYYIGYLYRCHGISTYPWYLYRYRGYWYWCSQVLGWVHPCFWRVTSWWLSCFPSLLFESKRP